MYTSPNMLLEIWDLGDDDFDYTVMASNQALIDEHDHSSEHGKQINGSTGIAAGSITQTQLASLSVGNPQLQFGSVGNSQLQPDSVGASNLQPGSVGPGAIANGAITAALLDPTIIPLGFVTTWWRPPGTTTIPGGFWEICDGRAWSSITNGWDLIEGNIPDMRGQFAQGADPVAAHGPAIGATGGSSTVNFNHTHQTPAHYHSIPAHNHFIDADGLHAHTWYGGYQIWSRTNAFPIGTTIEGASGNYFFNGYYSLYINGLANNAAWQQESGVQPGISGVQHPLNQGETDMDQTGLHSHGGGTGYTNLNTSAGGNGTTDYGTLGTISTVPPYTGLLYIMRCR